MIHPTAIVDPAARIGAQVTIGPTRRTDVEIGDHTEVGPHVVIKAHPNWSRESHLPILLPSVPAPRTRKIRR